jgi:small multidrug resistance family-3 protein
MKLTTTLLILFIAAVLEASGDAVVRTGLHTSNFVYRLILFLTGGVILFAYGWVVNSPSWDFGRLLGIYVVFFFVVAQLISTFVFKQTPALPVLIGGAFVVTGGLIMSLAQ